MKNFELRQEREECCWIWRLEFIGKKPQTLEEAWALSLEKWQLMTDKYALYVIDGGEHTCGLCMLYREKEGCPCCPVQQYSGQEHCKGTPYHAFLLGEAKPEQVYNFLIEVQAST